MPPDAGVAGEARGGKGGRSRFVFEDVQHAALEPDGLVNVVSAIVPHIGILGVITLRVVVSALSRSYNLWYNARRKEGVWYGLTQENHRRGSSFYWN